ncbi:MAG TPA: glycosyltransferase family 4 protein [Pirellulales bacterium]|nr:glycosyltransferase family 4 protein [Pirellulales bacterium]
MRICFVLPYAYPLFEPGAGGRFGGAEFRAVSFGRQLAGMAGYEIAFAVRDQGQPHRQRIDGIDVFTMPDDTSWDRRLLDRLRGSIHAESRFPWLKIDRWRPGLAWELPAAVACLAARALRRQVQERRFANPARRRVLEEIGADVYASFGTHHVTAEVVAFCGRRRCRSVLFVSSDYDLLEQYHRGSSLRNIYGERGHVCHFGLAHADLIVVQTARQQALLQNRFGRSSVLIRNPIDLCQPAPPPARRPAEGFALWIGKADDYKRPELCLELARRCHEIPFMMIVNRAAPNVFETVSAQRPPNVEMVEQVPQSQIDDYYRRAAVLVNTSAYEGMPNTFLQAGMHGIPVVTLVVDPDGMLSASRCGFCAGGDLEAMAADVTRIWRGADEAVEFSRNIRAYVERHHDLAGRAAELDRALTNLVGGEKLVG